MGWSENLKGGVAAIVIIALLAAALAVALDSFQEQIESDASSLTITNESVTWTNATATGMTKGELVRSCTNVWNGTGGVLIGSGNYTCADTGITITDINNASIYSIGSSVLVTYAYQEDTVAYNVTGEGLTGTTNATSFLDSIGIMIAIAALLAIVATAFFLVRR